MRLIYVIHILAGSLSLLFGYVALYSLKGLKVHRAAGMVFVYSMLAMCIGGAILGLRDTSPWSLVNVRAAILTAYLVVTAFTTVRAPFVGSQALGMTAMLVALTVGTISLTFGIEAVANGGRREGVPAFPFFLFGFVGLAGAAGDIRVLQSGALTGSKRIARHLWRMSFALLIAAMSFFIGQAKVIPKPVRIMPLLALPVVAVLVTMLYWLWRVRIRQSMRGIVSASS